MLRGAADGGALLSPPAAYILGREVLSAGDIGIPFG